MIYNRKAILISFQKMTEKAKRIPPDFRECLNAFTYCLLLFFLWRMMVTLVVAKQAPQYPVRHLCPSLKLLFFWPVQLGTIYYFLHF